MFYGALPAKESSDYSLKTFHIPLYRQDGYWRHLSSAAATRRSRFPVLLFSIGALLILVAGNPARAQSAPDGLPWYLSGIYGYGYNVPTGTCSGNPGVGVGQCCGPTTDAVQCANQAAVNACAHDGGAGVWCGITATSCAIQDSVLAQCSMSNGTSFSPVTPQPVYFVSTHSLAMADCGTCPRNNNNHVADPIGPANGNVSHRETDVVAPALVVIGAFERFYNSADPRGTDLGVGWRHSFSRQIVASPLLTPYQPYFSSDPRNSASYGSSSNACTFGWSQVSATSNQWANTTSSFANNVCSLTQNGSVIATIPVFSGVLLPLGVSGPTVSVTAIRDDGQQISFTLNGSTIVAPAGITLRLTQTGTGYQLIDDDDTVEIYNLTGQLISVTTRAGVAETLVYDSSKRLSTITDSFGHKLILGYNAQSQLVSVTDPSAHAVQYGYDSQSRLSTVTNLDTTSRSYVYENTTFPTLLTGIIDENTTRFSTWGYNAQGQGNSSQEAGGAGATSLIYNPNGSVAVTDALGAVRTFTFNIIGNQNRVVGIGGSQCPTCQESASTTYDTAGWVASRTDYNGNLTCYANDPVRGLELVRVEGFAPGSTCPSSLSTYTPVSGTLQRKISTTWSSTWREPSLITEPNRTTVYTFYSNGTINTKIITDTSVTPNVSRTWTYTYNGYGQVLTVDGPRTDVTDVTTYAYYTCSSGYQCGQVHTITDALGHITTFNTYNAYGQPLTITDPNGVLTTLTYDARQRLTSRQVGTETTGYTYWPTGLLKLVTLPDSSTVQFTYDGAHRLTTLTDGLGNYIKYTLDALGNRTADNSYDPSGTVHRTHTRVFNTLNQLYQDINAAGGSAVTSTYGYDANGNQKTINAPLMRNTTNVYDALNRLSQITDPASRITKLGYDANDNLASVIDPRTFTTSYSHNGFNDSTKLVSPDTGMSSRTYDSGGNLATTTDARSALATYSYDALNRESKVVYSDQTINFTYDTGTNGKGRLTGASDANHSMSWSYETLGRVTGKGQTVAGITKSVGYSYTNGDLTSLVTPSGQTITYTYTNHRITAVKVNTTTLLSGVTYDPFGPVTGWTWSNASVSSRSYDLDGNPGQIVTPGLSSNVTNVYTVDSASRITGITDSGTSSISETYGYDLLDRVSSGVRSAKNVGYTYDANGNRSTQTGSSALTDTIATTSNRLNATSGYLTRTYGYDSAGNTLSYTGDTFTFNQRDRMSSSTVTAGTTNYLYNALGQMIEKSGNGGTTLLMYDEAGHLLGEYSSTGALIQETIWAADRPVATLRPNGATVSIYYVHTDHLGTPRKVTGPLGNALVWRWDPDTFGTGTGTQILTYNLRFAGQYFLAESGLYYNYFRTYDPQMGRYLESDPIGLAGGQLSTYGYVDNNPISFFDPKGTGPVGAVIGGILGGVGGFVGGTALGAGGGTLVAPGVGTVAGGIEGAYVGTVGGVITGAAIGDRVGDWLDSLLFSRNPFAGQPGSETTCPNPKGGPKQTRRYGNDGYPETDTDWDHDHGQGKPHVHDWDRPSNGGPPTDTNRGPGRPPQPGDPGNP